MRAFQVAAVVVGLFVGSAIISACGDNASATTPASGVSQADFDALVARVALLESARPPNTVFSGGAVGAAAKSAGTRSPKAVAANQTELGTLLGYIPGSSPVFASVLFSLKSTTGYLYTVLNSRSADGTTNIGGLGDNGQFSNLGSLYFASSDCSGSAFVSGDRVSDYGALQGTVFAVGGDPISYLYVPSNSTGQALQYQSSTFANGSCTTSPGTLDVAYGALPNDAAVTGVQSALIPLPISLGQ